MCLIVAGRGRAKSFRITGVWTSVWEVGPASGGKYRAVWRAPKMLFVPNTKGWKTSLPLGSSGITVEPRADRTLVGSNVVAGEPRADKTFGGTGIAGDACFRLSDRALGLRASTTTWVTGTGGGAWRRGTVPGASRTLSGVAQDSHWLAPRSLPRPKTW